MALQSEANDKIVGALTASSPLLSEVAALLAQTSLPVAGLPMTDPSRAVSAAHTVRSESVTLASLVTGHAEVVSQAAPDLALAAPDVAVAVSG